MAGFKAPNEIVPKLFLKTQNLPGQFRIALSFGVKLAVNVEPTVFAGVDDVHQIPNRCTIKVSRMLCRKAT